MKRCTRATPAQISRSRCRWTRRQRRALYALYPECRGVPIQFAIKIISLRLYNRLVRWLNAGPQRGEAT